MLLVGLDAASQFEKFGFALGKLEGDRVVVSEAGVLGKRAESVLDRIAAAIQASPVSLIAIDAPLGWPEAMGRLLPTHQAGQALPIRKNAFFRRRTDHMVKAATDKNPLEVGADRIARAAHHAVEILERLRVLTGQEIQLAWEVPQEGAVAIEVYPAATLTSRDCDPRGYKDEKSGSPVRRKLAVALKREISNLEKFAGNTDHEFDACLCLLAGKDFLNGKVVQPDNSELARREGWIWVRSERSTDEIWARVERITGADGA